MSEIGHPPTSRAVVLFINSLLVVLLVRVLWEVPGFRTTVCRDVRFNREVVDVRALGDGSAVAVWRDSFGTFWLDRVDRAGALDWRAPIEGQPQHGLASYALASNTSSVFVRYVTHRRDAVRVRAYARDSGAFLWDAVIETRLAFEPALDEWFTTDIDLVATEAVVVASVAWSQQVKALDAMTGHVTATSTYEAEFHYPHRVGDDVVVRGGRPRFSGLTRLGRLGATAEDGNLVCPVGNMKVRVHSTKEASVMRPFGQGGESILESFVGLLRKCGSFNGNLVALGEADGDRQLRVLMWSRVGRLLSNVPLGHDDEHERDVRSDREKGTFSGELTRFIPHLVFDGKGVSIVMVDLVDGRIAWRSRASSRRMIGAALFHEGGRWILTDRRPQMIAVFDGHTGALDVAIEPATMIGAVSPSDSDAHGLWLHGDGAADPGRSSIARLDLSTFTTTGLEVREGTEELRRELGIP